jgi:hypothetical protein
MTKYDQRWQKVDTQINAENVNLEGDINITTVLEPTECYLCGNLCLPNEAYRCKRCHRVFCITHRTQTNSPFCQHCLELTRWETVLSSPNGDERIEAAKQLCALKEISTLPILEQRLAREHNEYVRYWIAFALGKIGGDKAYKILKKAQSREKSQFAQQGIQDALNELERS